MTREFEGISTFMRSPLSEIKNDIDIGFIGVTFDLGTTSSPGTRLGPKSLRDISTKFGKPNFNKIKPFELCKIADLGDVPFESFFDIEKAHNEIYNYYRKLKKSNIIPITAGGDHSITHPILKALGEEQPLALIHFDSHCDTYGELGKSNFHHGAPFKNAVLDNSIDPKSTVQVGIRGSAEELWDFSYKSGMHVFHIEECYDIGIDTLISKIRAVVKDKPTYLSFDIDAVDPAFAPGTGTPEVGGFTSLEAIKLIRGCRGLNIVGADLVEVSPILDHGHTTSLLGANLMYEMLCIIAESKKNNL